MKVGYVVLYVSDAEACRRFWVEQVGMVEKWRKDAGAFTIVQVGFADQAFAFELVPLALMKDNPDGLDLATPSIAFHVDDLALPAMVRYAAITPSEPPQDPSALTRRWLRGGYRDDRRASIGHRLRYCSHTERRIPASRLPPALRLNPHRGRAKCVRRFASHDGSGPWPAPFSCRAQCTSSCWAC